LSIIAESRGVRGEKAGRKEDGGICERC